MAEPDSVSQAEGLLEQIADTALDDDYYVVRSGPYKQSREFNTVLTGIVLAIFALLVAIAAIQTRTDRPATERERTSLINDVASRKQSLADREATVDSLRKQVDDLKSAVVGIDPAYERLRVQTADRSAVGPGIVVRLNLTGGLDKPITDRDLQMLVNGLWFAGAEAVAINDERIGSLTSIRTASGIIKVNFEPIESPFVLQVIGNSETLKERFAQTPVGRHWIQRGEGLGVEFDVTPSSNLSVGPAAKDRLRILHAKAIKEDE